MREHLVEKYFRYRRRYVDHILNEAPQRALLAVVSEVARLAFVATGSTLCALILWFLTLGALTKPSGWSAWSIPFAALAAFATLAAAGALRGALTALFDRPRVASLVAGSQRR
jgi:hypothetical protein